MRVERRLDAAPERVFDLIERSVAADMEQSGRKVGPKGIRRGTSYTKAMRTKLGAARTVTVRVEAFEAPRLYEASFTSSDGVNTVRYEVGPADGGSTLSYEESFVAPTTLGSLNGRIMQRLYARRAKRRMEAMLDVVEARLADAGE
ncbi:DUF3284 domain-containing protein [Caniella muris]|uniref:DUF3284 domain-containing protein n=1 Tax=Caniella muris TaxID=2941502 RepID=UPI00203F9CC1|nr:DUF3284 domain-containing protein [Caniella muris]